MRGPLAYLLILALALVVLPPPAVGDAPQAEGPASTDGCSVAPGAAALRAAPATAMDLAGGPAGLMRIDGTDPADVHTDIGPAGDDDADEEALPCSGIRPGARMISPAGCTMNWIFRDADGDLYVGTAGHCVSAVGQAVSVSGVGVVGHVVYTRNGGVGNDFALVSIDPIHYNRVDPRMCEWGGPFTTGSGSTGDDVRVYGHGTVWGSNQVTRPRPAVSSGDTPTTVRWTGLSAGGDSGMPIMLDDGTAIGIHTHTTGGVTGQLVEPKLKYGTSIGHAIGLAEAGTGFDIELVTDDGDLLLPPL